MIPLYFPKTYSNPRLGELCKVGIPFPQGELTDADMAVVSCDSAVVPSKSKATSYWADGSIKWLFTAFLADLPANAEQTYELSYKGELTGSLFDSKCVNVTKEGYGFSVDTGVLHMQLQAGRNAGIMEASAYSNKYYSGNFDGPILQDAKGRSSSFAVTNWTLQEDCGIYATLLGTGAHTNGKHSYQAELKLSFTAGSATVDASYRIVNTSRVPLMIDSLEFLFNSPFKSVRTFAAISGTDTDIEIGEMGEPVGMQIGGGDLMSRGFIEASDQYFGTMMAGCFTESGGLCGSFFEPYQNFPKAVYADEDGFVLRIVPHTDPEIVLHSGMSRTQRFMLSFFDADKDIDEMLYESLTYQIPDTPTVPAEIFEKSGVSKGAFVKDKRMDIEYAIASCANSHAKAFGMMHWGDVPESTYGISSGDEPVWSNNQFDFVHACSALFVRSGVLSYMRHVHASAVHLMDVDVCHYSDNDSCEGGILSRSIGHTLDGKLELRDQRIQGLLDYYHLTGEKRAFDIAVGVGNHVEEIINKVEYMQDTEDIMGNCVALATMSTLYDELHDKRYLANADRIIEHMASWNTYQTPWLLPYSENTLIRDVFTFSIAVKGLYDYYKISKRDDIKQIIIAEVNDIVDHCYDDVTGRFFEKEFPAYPVYERNAPVLDCLVIAHELTGVASYLKYGKETFLEWVRTACIVPSTVSRTAIRDAVVFSGIDTKNFAMNFLPVMSYYHAAVKEGVI